ncbi:MAG: hypothetical protein CL811_12570, partial [Colwelliaceae bacterium]|nr:hypothetical protein [Colwelliaceae bacterium]
MEQKSKARKKKKFGGKSFLNISIIVILALALLLPGILGGHYVFTDSFPFVEYVDDDEYYEDNMTGYSLNMQRVAATQSYDDEGNVIDNVTLMMQALWRSERATDTGLDAGQGVHLDWENDGIAERCLRIDIGLGLNSDTILGTLLTEVDYTIDKDQRLDFYKLEIEEEIYEVETEDRVPTEVEATNGSEVAYDIVTSTRTTTQTTEEWVAIAKNQSFVNRHARLDQFIASEDGSYKACYHVPFNEQGIAWGSEGTVYLDIATLDQSYVDLQNSSWWNSTYDLRRQITLTNNHATENIPANFTFNISVDTNTLIAGGQMKSDCTDLRILCGAEELDRMFFNETNITWEQQNTGCDSTDTQVLFRLGSNISASSVNDSCYMYYDNNFPGDPPREMSKIFIFADTFDRADETPLTKWENGSGAVDLVNGKANVTSSNAWAYKEFHTGQVNDMSGYTLYGTFNESGSDTGQGPSIVLSLTASAQYGDANSLELRGLTSEGANPSTVSIMTGGGATTVKSSTYSPGFTVPLNYTMNAYHNGSGWDFEGTMNGTAMSWNNTNSTVDKPGAFRYTIITGNRADDQIDNIVLRRYISPPPSSSVSGAETEATPTHDNPTINATSTQNLSNDHITIYNVSTAHHNNVSVYNIYQWYRNGNPLQIRNFPFAGGDDNTSVNDYSSNGQNGVVVGATTNATGGRDGGMAYEFSPDPGGFNQFINLTGDLNLSHQNFTVSIWGKLTQNLFDHPCPLNVGTGTNRCLLFNVGYEFATTKGFLFEVTDDRLRAYPGIGEPVAVYTFNSAEKAILNQWNLYTFTWNETDGNASIYFNGELKASSTVSLPHPHKSDRYSISSLNSGSRSWNGTLDDAMIFNEVLSQQQITAIYNNQTNLIHRSLTKKGEEWTGQIYPNNNQVSGLGKNASLTVLNNAPTTPTTKSPQDYTETWFNHTFNCSGSTDVVDNDAINYEFWINKTPNFDIYQNSSATTLNYFFPEANGTYTYNCRANDAEGVSAFTSTNTTIVFNNSIVIQNRSHVVDSPQSGQNYTYTLNLSTNGIRVTDANASLYIDGVKINVVETNYSNLTDFSSTYFVQPNTTDYNLSGYWNVTTFDTNDSTHQFHYPFTQQAQGISALTTGCTESNSTVWAVMNFTLRHEVNETLLTGDIESTFFIWLAGNNPSTNLTYNIDLQNVTNVTFCIDAPNTSNYQTYGQIRYVADTFDYRDYYLINSSLTNVTQNYDLFLLDIDLATGITFNVLDEVDNPKVDHYVYVRRYDVGTNTYKVVAMGKTDENGQDFIFLRQNDVFYQIEIWEDQVVKFISENKKITSTELFFTLVEATYSQFLDEFSGVDSVVTFDNSTNTFLATYASQSGISEGCLRVVKHSLLDETFVCDQCVASASGAISCDV